MVNKKMMIRALVLGTAVALSGSVVGGVAPGINTGLEAKAVDGELGSQVYGTVSVEATTDDSFFIAKGPDATDFYFPTIKVGDTPVKWYKEDDDGNWGEVSNPYSFGVGSDGPCKFCASTGGSPSVGTPILEVSAVIYNTEGSAWANELNAKIFSEAKLTFNDSFLFYDGDILEINGEIACGGEDGIYGEGGTIKFPDTASANDVKNANINNSEYNNKVKIFIGDVKVNNQGVALPKADFKTNSNPKAKSGLAYTGASQTLIDAGVSEQGTPKYALGTKDRAPDAGDYKDDLTAIVGKDAGDYYVYYFIEGDADHNDSDVMNIKATIHKKALTIKEVTVANKGYDTTTAAEVTGVTFNETAPVFYVVDDYTYTADFANPNVGDSKTVTGTIELKENGPESKNYSLTNGSFTSSANIIKGTAGDEYIKTASGQLRKKEDTEITIKLPDIPATMDYGTLPDFTGNGFSAVYDSNTENIIVTAKNTWESAGAADSFEIPVTGSNYDEYTITVTITPVDASMYTQSISANNITATYGDVKNVSELNAQVTINEQDVSAPQPSALTYVVKSGSDNIIGIGTGGEIIIKKAGIATITVKAPENTSDNVLEATEDVTLKISKKQITVKPKDLPDIEVGGTVPTLNDPATADDYIITGLVSGDTVTTQPTLSYEGGTPEADSAKTVHIVADGIVLTPASGASMDDCYDVKYEKGTLNIKDSAPSKDITVSVNPTSYQASVGEKNVEFTATVTGNSNAWGYEIKFKPSGSNAWRDLPSGVKFDNTADFSKITLSFPSVTNGFFGEYRLTVFNKNDSQGRLDKTVTMTLSRKGSSTPTPPNTPSSGGGSGNSSSGGSAGGSLSRPPVTTPNSGTANNDKNNNNANNDTPAGSNVPVSSYAHANAGRASQVIRLLNPASGEHIITTNAGEAEALIAEHGWKREAVAGISSNANNSPVFRMFHAATGKHIYSMSAKEIAALVEQGWTNEGVTFFAGGSNVKMYRLHNPDLPVAVAHHFTTEEGEYNALQQQGWTGEGVAFTLD